MQASVAEKKLGLVGWSLIAFFSLVKFFLSFRLSLGADEAHYALYGLNVDWSYYDHPPLIGWVNALFIAIFGMHDWVVRLPAILCGAASSILGFRLVLEISGSRAGARWALLALNVSFLLFGLFFMFLPDSLLLPLGLWLVFIVNRIYEKNDLSSWLQLGLCLGLCGLTKYTAIFFVVSLLALALSDRKLKEWMTIRLALAVIVAFVMILPVLYWNHLHDWASFSYQTNHVVGSEQFSWARFFQSLTAQIIAYSPFLVLTSLAVLVRRSPYHPWTRVILYLTIPCALFFLYSGLKDFVLPHWTLNMYAFLFVAAFAEAFRQGQNKKSWPQWGLKISAGVTALIVLVVISELSLHWYPFKDNQTAYGDLIGWDAVEQQLTEYKKQNPGKDFSIAVPNWTLGSRAAYYLSAVAPVFVLDQRNDQFDIWEKDQPLTADFILLQWKGFDFDAPLSDLCESHQVLQDNTFRQKNYVVTSMQIVFCQGLRPQWLRRHQ